ncbi:MAG: imidazole glycerol phosphate synthase subunit HisH [Arcobacter sp.]|uniref:imidazole glycerol phosphate synthase subunit HisH n=1 Tax=uncultured Arcobacter sp. TaxID=165434 RepID=UPI000CB2F4B7|nr:imidazole glycerol phosphate synthase subunit HisH [uncultured Arcobacter sp.]PLY10473.1 MAG: imidazole glycerol phosphate synthase subunit HisH [Arcobacter sp.]
MIVVIDYGMGNVGSIVNMIKRVGYECIVSSSVDDILNASKLILPGVGSFDNAMKNLQELNLIDPINKQVIENKIPILGICLGMQLLTKGSEEGILEGFSYINGYSNKLDTANGLLVPHMGWNLIDIKKINNLYDNDIDEQRFYFVHSFVVSCKDNQDILTTTCYGKEFVSSFQKDNIIGVQFHPEKSHTFGIHFFKNFLENF